MKKLILVLLGIIPFVIGKFYSELIISNNMDGKDMMLFSVAFLALWFVVGATSRKFTRSFKEAVLYTHLLGALSLVLVFIQTLITGGFFSNFVGIYTQMYFLPAVRLASEIEMKLLFFTKTHYILPVFIVVSALMIAVYALGFKVAENRK